MWCVTVVPLAPWSRDEIEHGQVHLDISISPSPLTPRHSMQPS